MTTFLSLFIVFDIVYMVYMLSRPAAARRKMQREKERQAAERQAKAEARKQEQAAAKANKAAKAAAQPPRKRGRPRTNPPKQPAAARKQAKPAAPVPAERPAPVPVEPKPVNNAPKTGVFAGEVVAFTGTCPKMERRYMVSHVNRLGGQGYETINTRCTLLVVAENPGRNQLDKAARWHVPTITWEEWWERAFNYPATTKPKPAEDDIVSLDQYASLIHNAA